MPKVISQEQARKLVGALQSGQLNENQTRNARALLETYKFVNTQVLTDPVPTGDPMLDQDLPAPGPATQFIPRPGPRPSERNIAPESPEGMRRSNAAAGVDQMSGMDFGGRMKLALAFNNPQHRTEAVASVLTDMGLATQVPQGYPIYMMADDPENPYGQDVFLRQTTEQDVERGLAQKDQVGKYRWTTIEDAGFTLGDLGDIMDAPETLGTVGAMVGEATSKRIPLMGAAGSKRMEYLGGVLGRNLGTFIEYLTANGEVTDEELYDQIKNSFGVEAANLAASRLVQFGANKARISMESVPSNSARQRTFDPDTSRDVLKERMEVVADDMDRLYELGGTRIALTPGEATDDVARLTEEGSQLAVSPSKVRKSDAIRIEGNMTGLRAANRGVNRTSTDYEPSVAADMANYEYQLARNSAREEAKAAGDVIKFHSPMTDKSNVEVYQLRGAKPHDHSYTGTLPPEGGLAVRRGSVMGMDDVPSRQVVAVSTGPEMRGLGQSMYRQAADDAVNAGERLVSDSDMTVASLRVWRKLEDLGYGVNWRNIDDRFWDLIPEKYHYGKDLDAFLNNAPDDLRVARAQDPFVFIDSLPADRYARTLETIPDTYDRALMNESVEAAQENFIRVQTARDGAAADLNTHIGWNDGKARSMYVVNNNTSGNKLGREIAQLRAEADQALLRDLATPSQRMLANAFETIEDETGEALSRSLADRQLDVGQLIRARDHLMRVADEADSAPARRVATALDSLLNNAKIVHRHTGAPVESTWRAGLQQLDGNLAQLNATRAKAQRIIDTNAMFVRDSQGNLTNTSAEAIARLTRNDSGKLGDVMQAASANPTMKMDVVDALWNNYKQASGIVDGAFNHAAHKRWVKEHSDAIDLLFDPEEAARIKSVPMAFREAVDKTTTRLKELRMHYKAATGADWPAAGLKPDAMYQSLWRMSGRARERFLGALDPRTRTQVIDHAKMDIQRTLDVKYFSATGDRTSAETLHQYIDKNRPVWDELFGPGYAADMKVIARMYEATNRRAIRAVAPESQSGWMRVTRSLIGPLSKPQRFITAANWNKQRILARNILKVISDPEKLRQFRIVGDNTDLYTRAGIIGLTRIGLLEGTGINPQDGDAIEQMREMFELAEDLRLDEEYGAAPEEKKPTRVGLSNEEKERLVQRALASNSWSFKLDVARRLGATPEQLYGAVPPAARGNPKYAVE